ncbi:MAG: beta-hydroxyacyl-ACP dehydratase [Bacteriovoracaceae bacterium]|nr:beta-hydroxyacyl-ACP dehydratase [Bacteriovoracaceae bacterium]
MLIGNEEVKEFLPHRDPFLFVDSIKDIQLREGVEKKDVYEIKDVIGGTVFGNYATKADHPIFAGHFPGNPILPGVVQIEMMAQVSSFALMKIYPNWKDLRMDVMLLGVNSSKFRKPVFPEMKLTIKTECEKVRGPFMTNNCTVYCEGEVMSEASVLASVKFVEK